MQAASVAAETPALDSPVRETPRRRRFVAEVARLPLRTTRSGVGAAIGVGQFGATVAGKTLRSLDVGPRRTGRAVWSSPGRAHIEVRGLADESAQHSVLGDALQSTLRALRGVHWAEVNAVTGHVLVLFDHRSVDMDELVGAVESVEAAHGTEGTDWPRDVPPHPSDRAALTGAVTALAADCMGLGAATIGRLFRIRPVPVAARALVGIVEAQPRLRGLVERALGPAGTDIVVGVASGVMHGLSGGVGPLLPTTMSHALLVAEVRSRRAVWERREPELCSAKGSLPQSPPVKVPRSVPFPSGPVETFAERVAAGSLLVAGGVFAVTRSVARASSLLLVGVPPAARLGREAFAGTLSRQLSRRGAVPMDPGAFRRLDRITAVVLDESALYAAHNRVPGAGTASRPGKSVPRPLAKALQQLAQRGVIVVRTGGGIDDQAGSVAESTVETIRRLQHEGHGVLAIAASDNEVLAAADVAIAVHSGDAPVGWSADLICGPTLDAVAILLSAVPEARALSRRAVVIAAAGSLAATVLTTFSPWPTSDITMQPIYLTGVLTQLDGAQTAARVRA